MQVKYSTKFSNLTLAINEEPRDFIIKRKTWPAGKIYNLLKRISVESSLPMISQRTLYIWLSKCNNAE